MGKTIKHKIVRIYDDPGLEAKIGDLKRRYRDGDLGEPPKVEPIPTRTKRVRSYDDEILSAHIEAENVRWLRSKIASEEK